MTINQATDHNGYTRLMSLVDFEVVQFTFIGGDFGVSYQMMEKIVYGQKIVAPDLDTYLESMFQLVLICTHCEQVHAPILVWHPTPGLMVADPDKLAFNMPLYLGNMGGFRPRP